MHVRTDVELRRDAFYGTKSLSVIELDEFNSVNRYCSENTRMYSDRGTDTATLSDMLIYAVSQYYGANISHQYDHNTCPV